MNDGTVEPPDDPPFRGRIRLVSQRRVSHGVGVDRRDGLSAEVEFRRDLKAYLLVLPKGATFTHLTGARLLGWDLPRLPEHVPVFASVPGKSARPRRSGLICSRVERQRESRQVFGLPVDEPEEILLRAARDLGLIDLLILLESALQRGHVDDHRMTAILGSGRPGVRMLRHAWLRATGRSESPGETLLQEFHRVMGVPFEPQVDLVDDDGVLIGRADLQVVGTRFVHEYDGAHHRDGQQQRIDLRRERRLGDTRWIRKGFVLDDLVNHGAVLMHELDRALERPHDLGRLRRWRSLVTNSLYDERGRERILNRWRRRSGLVDWTGSA